MVDDNVVGIVAIVSIFVFSPIAIAYARMVWRRANSPPASKPILNDETAHRIIQMQQSIDAMALEIERISEGQRFVTKVLAERSREPAALQDRSQKQ